MQSILRFLEDEESNDIINKLQSIIDDKTYTENIKLQARDYQQYTFRYNLVQQGYYDFIKNLKVQQKEQTKKIYNYNRSNTYTRVRSKQQKLQQYCPNCQQELQNNQYCINCNYTVEYICQPAVVENQKVKFMQFLEYYQGLTNVPCFVYNYVNNLLLCLAQQVKENKLEGPKPNEYITIDFPVKIKYFSKRRLEIKGLVGLSSYEQQQITIPHYSYKQFEQIMRIGRKYYEKYPNLNWDQASYVPRDYIYLNTIYITIFNAPSIKITEEDQQKLLDYYMKILDEQKKITKKTNNFVINQVITSLILHIPQFQKYKVLTDYVKTQVVNSTLQQIIDKLKEDSSFNNL